jgi:hypothetical protein
LSSSSRSISLARSCGRPLGVNVTFGRIIAARSSCTTRTALSSLSSHCA